MLTVFANMRINSAERLQHLKESFESFESESDDWLINIRGSHRDEALAFLRERLGERGTFFELLDDSRGWIVNALEMLPHAKHDLVVFWLEDHINISPKGHLQQIARDMRTNNVGCLLYTWWNVGWHDLENQRAALGLKSGGSIEWADIDVPKWKEVLTFGEAPYLVSIASIFNKRFLEKLLRGDRRKLPYACTPFLYRVMTLLQRIGLSFDQKTWFHRINKLLRYKLRRFVKETPFDLEKAPDRFDMLPMRAAFPVRELFVCIDDDAVPEPHGYSLTSRGKYPLTERLVPWSPTELESHESRSQTLPTGGVISERYVYYGIKGTRSTPVREHLKVLRGSVRVTVDDTALTLSEGAGAAYYTNIPHEIEALVDSEVQRYLPKTGLAPHYFSA